MRNKKTVAVVIPIYKSDFTELEEISLRQVKHILHHYDLFFVMPESLQIETDAEILEERFEESYFADINAYSRLMMNKEFYLRFEEYEYILIYQLDAFVFEDKLTYFCKLGYDYIGAPWLSGVFCYKDVRHAVWSVGNGGLSLRKVDSTIRYLEENKEVLKNRTINEDVFFATADGENFSVAPKEVALQFAFEMEVQECFEKNKNNLPFGCHAWHRFDLQFWKPHIESDGHEIPEEYLPAGQEDKKRAGQYAIQRKNNGYWQQEYRPQFLRENLAAKLRNPDKPYVIWGAGYWGMIMCAMLRDAECKVEAFIDGNQELYHAKISECPVMSFADFVQAYGECNVVIALAKGAGQVANLLDREGYVRGEDYLSIQEIDVISQNVIL